LGQLNKSFFLFVFWSLFCFGLTLSKSLISIGFIGIVVVGILNFNKHQLSNSEKKLCFVLILSFLLTCLSLVYSRQITLSIDKIVLKLPLLLIPFAIFAFKNSEEKLKFRMTTVLNYALFLPAVVSVYNYLINKTLFDGLILQSKPLPIEFGYGLYHIQFSVLLAAAIVLGVISLLQNLVLRYQITFWFLLVLVVVNIVALHILSARTGLLSLYAAAFVVIYYYFKKIEFKKKLTISAFIIVLPLLFILFSTSLKHRIFNTFEDLKVTVSGKDANDYSMAMRVAAWFNAFDVIKDNPLLGVGVGNVETVLKKNFETYNPKITPQNRKNPHNQFIETAVESGILNGVLLLLFFGLLFFLKFDKQIKLSLSAIGLLFLIACLFESLFERQSTVVGIVMIISFVLGSNAKTEIENKSLLEL
jgi:O-antigen ligase